MSRAGQAIALSIGRLSLIAVLGCATVDVTSAPYFSRQQEEFMAREAAVAFEIEHPLWTDPLLAAYVRQIIQRLDHEIPADRRYSWSVRIVDSSAVNAFTFGGGVVYLYAGLIARLENEAQLAMVLAHEMAHSTQQHIMREMNHRFSARQQGGNAGSILPDTGGSRPASDGVTLEEVESLGRQAASMGFRRDYEKEADELGMQYLIGAGYNPREAIRAFERLPEWTGDPPREEAYFYSDHPRNLQRLAFLAAEYEMKYEAGSGSGKTSVDTERYARRTRPIVIEVGKLDYANKRFSNSREMMEKAQRTYDRDPVPYYWLGKIAMDGEGMPEKAVQQLLEAITLDRDYREAYRELGAAYLMAGDQSKALKAYRRYLKLAPEASDSEQVAASIGEIDSD